MLIQYGQVFDHFADRQERTGHCRHVLRVWNEQRHRFLLLAKVDSDLVCLRSSLLFFFLSVFVLWCGTGAQGLLIVVQIVDPALWRIKLW